MLTKTKFALAAALMLGAGSHALANDIETNPSTAQSVREWRAFVGQNQTGNAGNAYGYVVSPKQAHRASHERTLGR
jgi:hypothetical protein